MSEYKLAQEIIALSVAKTWDEAKLEWALHEVYKTEEPETCLCGHFPIIELCVLRNKKNSGSATVGNCCVKKFIGLPSDKIFQAMRRVHSKIEKALNAETIEHAYEKRWINDWEKKFYFNTLRKRNLSNNQLSKRVQINQKILARLSRKNVSR